MRRATCSVYATIWHRFNFNPRSPWGERQVTEFVIPDRWTISIHALREESDQARQQIHECLNRISIHALREESDAFLVGLRATESIFQSTLSVRRATSIDSHSRNIIKYFNPRSPWGERPYKGLSDSTVSANFNPRSPWGERRYLICLLTQSSQFQSTLSVRRATLW